MVTPVIFHTSPCPGTRAPEPVLGTAEGLSGSGPSLTGEEMRVHGPGHWERVGADLGPEPSPDPVLSLSLLCLHLGILGTTCRQYFPQ